MNVAAFSEMPWNQRANAPTPGTAICAESDIDEAQGKGFSFGDGPDDFRMVVCRFDGLLHAYVNECPHREVPLELLEDQFFDQENRFLICSTHGALFQPEDGSCIHGPCVGASLSPIPIEVQDGQVVIAKAQD